MVSLLRAIMLERLSLHGASKSDVCISRCSLVVQYRVLNLFSIQIFVCDSLTVLCR